MHSSSVFLRSLLGAVLLFPHASGGGGKDALISISRQADDIEIKFFGALQSANTLTGPWSDESAVSPKKVNPGGVAKYYRIKPFELPATARFAVNLETGKVGVAPASELSDQEDRAAAVLGGNLIDFYSSMVLDEGAGNPGRKVLSVSLVNRSGETVGEDPNGVLAGIKVVFHDIKNLTAPTDLRMQTTVATLAGTGAPGSSDGPALSATFVKPTGAAIAPDGSIYVCDFQAHRIRKLSQHQVITLAGSGSPSSVDGIGAAASINGPWGIAYSAAFNGFVIAERNGRRLRLLSLDGVLTTIAGTGAASSNDGRGDVATFNDPIAIAVDGSGAIYVSEHPGNKIRKITFTGADPRIASHYTVETWAGSGVSGGADGVGTAAQFRVIFGLAAERDGTLYVTDAWNYKIRRVSPAREVVTIAGGGIAGSVNGNGAVAKFKGPGGIALVNGSLAVTDYVDNTLRWLTLRNGGNPQNPLDWQVRTLAGTGSAGAANGRGDVAQFNSPFSVDEDSAGNLIVTDFNNAKLRKVTLTDYFSVGFPAPTTVTEPVRLSNAEDFYSFTTVEGRAYRPFISYNERLLPGWASAAKKWAFEVPAGVHGFEFNVTVMAPTDTKAPMAVVSNPGPDGVGSPDVLVTTLAGTGVSGYVNGRANAAQFNAAVGITLDQHGNVYVADSDNHAIRRISKDRMVTTVAGGLGAGSVDGRGNVAKFLDPKGIAAAPDGKTLYVAELSNNSIRRVVMTGNDPASPDSWSVASIAGASVAGYVDNTSGTSARFTYPSGIAWAPGDVLYVTEYLGNRVRRIQPVGADLQLSGSWHVSLVAGSPVDAPGTTDANGSSARFDVPHSIAVDQAGFLYVAELNNNRIRKIDPNGDVTTLAGSSYGYADGFGAAGRFSQAWSIAVDSAGYVYVGDGSHRVRRVSPAGMVTTVAGGAFASGDLDGGGDVATFLYPKGIAIDAAGTLYVTSGSSSSLGARVRMIQRILK